VNRLHNAKLDWITDSPEKVVARHARASTKNPDKAEFQKLLTFCINQGHWSVFEQVCASFEIITSRAVSAQIIRHRAFHYQELSQRYCNPDKILDDAWENCWDFELRAQDFKDRQNSLEFADETVKEVLKERVKEVFSDIEDLYHALLGVRCGSGVRPQHPADVYPDASTHAGDAKGLDFLRRLAWRQRHSERAQVHRPRHRSYSLCVRTDYRQGSSGF
jgi:flavin-dependent thymidylate synthase